jgi:hypothetical protein
MQEEGYVKYPLTLEIGVISIRNCQILLRKRIVFSFSTHLYRCKLCILKT